MIFVYLKFIKRELGTESKLWKIHQPIEIIDLDNVKNDELLIEKFPSLKICYKKEKSVFVYFIVQIKENDQVLLFGNVPQSIEITSNWNLCVEVNELEVIDKREIGFFICFYLLSTFCDDNFNGMNLKYKDFDSALMIRKNITFQIVKQLLEEN